MMLLWNQHRGLKFFQDLHVRLQLDLNRREKLSPLAESGSKKYYSLRLSSRLSNHRPSKDGIEKGEPRCF